MSGIPKNSQQVGKVRLYVARLLTQAGFDVEPLDLITPRGYPQAHPDEYDQFSWEGSGKVRARPEYEAGLTVRFYSWDNMTTCQKYGITVLADGDIPCMYQVIANRPTEEI